MTKRTDFARRAPGDEPTPTGGPQFGSCAKDSSWRVAEEHAIRRLCEIGITPTSQRVGLARIFLSRRQHLSAEELLGIANRDGLLVSKATVYNTLGLFAKKGLVREVIVDPSKVFYDSNTTHHHHFYDVDAGELVDIDEGAIHIGALPPLPEGAVVEGVDVIVRIRRG